VALGKFWVAKRTPQFVYECLECLGGGGYVEEGPMARYYREAPLNAIWEGSGNVIALDILRTLQKDRDAMEAYFAELAPARGAHRDFDRTFDSLSSAVRTGSVPEAGARHIAESMALALQAALLLQHGSPEVASAFCELRLSEGHSINYGAGNASIDADSIIARQGSSA
ncbi:MAG: DNA alkylation response protein, partial [Rhodomicrobium sp.]|nr:DNA alkylation response protein [Rhodomicrobium sp.]